jgi:23S rRNA (guanosine2251-2'-O)-methyltransferase
MSEMLYSRQAVRECLRARRRKIHRLLIREGVEDAPILREIRTLAEAQRIRISVGAARQALPPEAQGVALEVGEYPYADLDDCFALAQARGERPFLLILDSVQDPHNMGNLVRTAEAAGVHGVVIGARRSASVTPAVVNASAGATEHMLIAQVVNLARAVEAIKARDVWVVALHGEAQQTLYELDLRGGLAFVIGSEGEGVSRLLREKADVVARLPMRGRVGSLNAAAAGAAALYEAVRQQSQAMLKSAR